MATETIRKEINIIDEALAIVCDRMNIDDRIADALLREVQTCIGNIQEVLNDE